MKSLERRFKNIAERNPYWSSYICFAEALRDGNFSRQTVHRWFYKLVSDDDYAKKEVKAILEHLRGLTEIKKGPEDNK